jgi:hypothetical protein
MIWEVRTWTVGTMIMEDLLDFEEINYQPNPQNPAKSRFRQKKITMKFINYLKEITGVDIYGMSSFLLFFTIFIIMLLWAWRADKKMIDTISNIPLED